MNPAKPEGVAAVLLHDSLIKDVLYQQDTAFIKAVKAALAPTGDQVMRWEINQNPPEGPWMRRLKEGHVIHLCKEQAWGRVMFPWQPSEPGQVGGRLVFCRIIYQGDASYRGETQIWYVGERGQGFDGKQLILPAKGHLAATMVEIIDRREAELLMRLNQMQEQLNQQELLLQTQQEQVERLHVFATTSVPRIKRLESLLDVVLDRLQAVEQEKHRLETFIAQKGNPHGGRRRRIRRRHSGAGSAGDSG